ncbi:sigma-70 family RNA polymerase sigma factor [Streptosporangium saharense]|uniref:sigma-70 family RNA polymerase sigma factor n=1 Tax=Streptosporangium saharense TaxID=1706840 RepID=UPI00367793D3
MDEHEFLAGRFEEHRAHLRSVAYRMLGSSNEAEDAVQEAWLRLSRSDADDVENLGGWLTTVVARVCLNMLRSRATRREEPLRQDEDQPDGQDPESEAIVADSVGLALLVVLETLTPAERLAFVLHDMFAVPFEEIAPIVERSPAATRQLASRARRRVRGAAPTSEADLARRREIVAAFLTASREGDFAALLAVLDPDVVLRSDRAEVLAGSPGPLRGASVVAETFLGRARGARPALVDGVVGAAWAPDGEPRVALGFTVSGDRITAIDVVTDPEHLRELDVTFL